MAAITAMVKINPEKPFSPQLKDFIKASNAACGHPKEKPETEEKLWFDIIPQPGYWKVYNIRGVKNPDQFNIKISRDFFMKHAVIITRAILMQGFFRKHGRKRAQNIKFYVNRSFNIYTIERWPRRLRRREDD